MTVTIDTSFYGFPKKTNYSIQEWMHFCKSWKINILLRELLKEIWKWVTVTSLKLYDQFTI